MNEKNRKYKLPKWLNRVRFSVVSKIVLAIYVIAGLTIYLTTMHKREMNTVHRKEIAKVEIKHKK